MTSPTVAAAALTAELAQVLQVNEELRRLRSADADPMLTAELLGLTGAGVHLRVLDRAAATLTRYPERRRDLPGPLDAAAPLLRLLATGPADAPFVYGIFAERHGRRELPVGVHAPQLRLISSALGLLHHSWGE
jgi:hypothetical protein